MLDLAECRDLSDLFDGGRFPTQHRPQLGARGHHRVGLRHGVSTVTCGRRTALGIIFHDAR